MLQEGGGDGREERGGGGEKREVNRIDRRGERSHLDMTVCLKTSLHNEPLVKKKQDFE